MFFHRKELQFEAEPDRPDPLFAKKLQELIGGQYGEMSVAMQYLFQGWSVRGNETYKDMLLDIGTEEIGHIEMLATMVSRLLDVNLKPSPAFSIMVTRSLPVQSQFLQ